MREYIDKIRSNRDKNLKYDFLPAMLEIIERPANKLGYVIIILVITLVVATLMWSIFARTDIVITAGGSITTKEEIRTLRTIQGGKIDKIFVEDGEVVTKGQELLKFDTSDLEVELEKNKKDKKLYEFQYDTYELIYEGMLEGISVDDLGLKEKLLSDKHIVVDEDTELLYDALIESQRKYEETIKGIKIQMKGSYSEKEIVDYLAQYQAEQKSTLLQNLNTIKLRLEETDEKITKINKEIEKMTLKADVQGNVVFNGNLYEDLYVDANQTCVFILPEEQNYQFEAYVNDNDIGKIEMDMGVDIKIQSLADTDYSRVRGKVIDIGELPVSNEERGNLYKVTVELDTPKDAKIKVGNAGNVEFIIGNRRIIEYFLEPFIRGMDGVLKED